MNVSQPIDDGPATEGRAVTVEISSEPGLAEILDAETPVSDERRTQDAKDPRG